MKDKEYNFLEKLMRLNPHEKVAASKNEEQLMISIINHYAHLGASMQWQKKVFDKKNKKYFTVRVLLEVE